MAKDKTTSDKKRPCVVIKGKGKTYKGLNIKLYYMILPRNLGQFIASGEGSNSCFSWSVKYFLPKVLRQKADGKKVKYSYETAYMLRYTDAKKDKKGKWKDDYVKTVKLKKKTDYVEHLYYLKKGNGGKVFWEEASDTSDPGTYLVTLEGKGNYCGTALYNSLTKSNYYDGEYPFGIDNRSTADHPLFPEENYRTGAQFVVVPKGDILMGDLKIVKKNSSLQQTAAGRPVTDYVPAANVRFAKTYSAFGYKKNTAVPATKYFYGYYDETEINEYAFHKFQYKQERLYDVGKKVKIYLTAADNGKYDPNNHIWGDTSVEVEVKNKELNKDKLFLQYSKDGVNWKKLTKSLAFDTTGDYVRVSSNTYVYGKDYETAFQYITDIDNGKEWVYGESIRPEYDWYGGNTYKIKVYGLGQYGCASEKDSKKKSSDSDSSSSSKKSTFYRNVHEMSFKRSSMKLSTAVKKGYITFTNTDETLNINGTFPTLTVKENYNAAKNPRYYTTDLTYNNEGTAPEEFYYYDEKEDTFQPSGNWLTSGEGKMASFTAKCSSHTAVGTGKLELTPKDNWFTSYTGTYTVKYKINQKVLTSVNWAYDAADATDRLYYAGQNVWIKYMPDLAYKADSSKYKPKVKVYQLAERPVKGKKYYFKELKAGKHYSATATTLSANNEVYLQAGSNGGFQFREPSGGGSKIKANVTWGTYRKKVSKMKVTLSSSTGTGSTDGKGRLKEEYTGNPIVPKVIRVEVKGKGDSGFTTFTEADQGYFLHEKYDGLGCDKESPAYSKNNVDVGNVTTKITMGPKKKGDAYEYYGTGKVVFVIAPFNKKNVVLSAP
ncbi:MAG: hypothetical protein K5985_08010, partial [Lachnospiraceae bacterium]|nr:hypothetical protein [Lachnospiraceae bacterium]